MDETSSSVPPNVHNTQPVHRTANSQTTSLPRVALYKKYCCKPAAGGFFRWRVIHTPAM